MPGSSPGMTSHFSIGLPRHDSAGSPDGANGLARGEGTRVVTPPVIAGLDPAIHPKKCILRRLMDARVKPGHDESLFNLLPTSQFGRLRP
jgi:hypothetical protein